MQVRFLKPWQGSSIGDVCEFVPFITEDLLSRKIVEPYVKDDKRDAKIEKLAKENASLKRKLKQIDTAPVDKQLKGAVVKK